jgi:hypothetical protein
LTHRFKPTKIEALWRNGRGVARAKVAARRLNSGGGDGVRSWHRYDDQALCTVNVTMTNGRVGRVNYVGPTGGLLTPGEQCAFAVQNCTR